MRGQRKVRGKYYYKPRPRQQRYVAVKGTVQSGANA